MPVLGVDLDVQLDVEREWVGMLQVWERCRVLLIVGHRKRLKKKIVMQKSKQRQLTWSASMVTTQGEIEVPRFLAPKGPRGIYSHFWMSLADQSFMRTMPKIRSCAEETGTGSPILLAAPPTKNAISSSKSISLQGPKTGGSASLGRV